MFSNPSELDEFSKEVHSSTPYFEKRDSNYRGIAEAWLGSSDDGT